MIKNNFIIFMKQMFCNFKPKTFSIDYLKALQIGSVGSDSVCINTLFSIYTYIYIYIYIEKDVNS